MYSQAVSMKMLVILGIVSLAFLAGCGSTSRSLNNQLNNQPPQSPPPSGGPPSGSNGTNPVPAINSLSPSCAPQGEQSLNPFVDGQLFVHVHPVASDRRTNQSDGRTYV